MEVAGNISISSHRKCDILLIKKLQILAPLMSISINPLARHLLSKAVDDKLQELDIEFSETQQPVSVAG